MSDRTADELTDIVVRDVTVGAQGTGIRSGIIGEVGINGRPLMENELKSERASGAHHRRADDHPQLRHRRRDAPGPRRRGVGGGGALRVVMSHPSGRGMEYVKKVAARRAFMELDYFGQAPLSPERDAKIVDAIVNLVQAGYADHILLAHDVCTQPQLIRNGGGGYTNISNVILRGLRARGVSDEVIRKIMVDNPSRALTFVAPGAALAG